MDDPKFKCPRCGSGMELKCNLKKHISKKTQCVAYIKDLNREELMDIFNKLGKNSIATQFQCEACKKYYSCNNSLMKHMESYCPHLKYDDKVTISASYLNKLLETIYQLPS